MLLQSHSIRLHRGRIELRLLLLRLRLLWLLIGRRDKLMMVYPGAVSGLRGICGLGSTLVMLLGLLVMDLLLLLLLLGGFVLLDALVDAGQRDAHVVVLGCGGGGGVGVGGDELLLLLLLRLRVGLRSTISSIRSTTLRPTITHLLSRRRAKHLNPPSTILHLRLRLSLGLGSQGSLLFGQRGIDLLLRALPRLLRRSPRLWLLLLLGELLMDELLHGGLLLEEGGLLLGELLLVEWGLLLLLITVKADLDRAGCGGGLGLLGLLVFVLLGDFLALRGVAGWLSQVHNVLLFLALGDVCLGLLLEQGIIAAIAIHKLVEELLLVRLGELWLVAIDRGLGYGSEKLLVGRRLLGLVIWLLWSWLLLLMLLRLAEVVRVSARGLPGADWLGLVLLLVGRLSVRLPPAVTMHHHLLLAVGGSISGTNHLVLSLGRRLVLPPSGFSRQMGLLELLRLLACRADLLHYLLLKLLLLHQVL